MKTRYVFRAKIRLEPEQPSVCLEPSTAETTVTVSREAPEPRTDGWPFVWKNNGRRDRR